MDEQFNRRLHALTEKWIEIEYRDFFKYVSYELTREGFDKELEEHDFESWISIYCVIHEKDEKDYRDGLWKIYCGNILSNHRGL